MIIDEIGTLLPSEDFAVFNFGKDTHYVSGFFYIPGFRSGADSVNQVELALQETGEIPFERLYGAYTYCISRANGEKIMFACNSNMHCLYISENVAGSSYIELLKYRQEHGKSLNFDEESVCEYYTLGHICFNKTQVKEVTILPNDSYVCWEGGTFKIVLKKIGGIDGCSNIQSPEDFFDDLAFAISERKNSLSLTGGYDSRMIFALLSKKMTLKLFYSTNLKTDSDGIVAQRVAAAANTPIEIVYTAKPNLSEELLKTMIMERDGLPPLAIDVDYRVRNFRKQLMNEEYKFQITGDGGVLHKDWEWMQDFPFYHKKHTNLRRFYHQRIAYACNAPALGNRLQECYRNQENRFIDSLQPYVKHINTESYDSLYYFVSGNARVLYNATYPGYTAYAPLEELDLVRYSYHLPRKTRFFYNFIRKVTTFANPLVARIPTNYGTTASSEPIYILRDIFFQLIDYSKKACRMIGRIVFHKSFFVGSTLDWTLDCELRELPVAQEAVSWAVKEHFLIEETTVAQLPYAQLTRIIHLYILEKELNIK